MIDFWDTVPLDLDRFYWGKYDLIRQRRIGLSLWGKDYSERKAILQKMAAEHPADLELQYLAKYYGDAEEAFYRDCIREDDY